MVFFEKTAEILLVQSDQGSQITDINFVLIMLLHIGNYSFDCLYPVVVGVLCLGKKLPPGQLSQNLQERGFDQKLVGQIHNCFVGCAKQCGMEFIISIF